jgi:pimeloyl-ACP methyl ester carboxylesterase
MNQPQPMRDVIVLIPGILGSVLVKNGQEVWGASAQSVIGNLLTFGRALKDLKLDPGVGHEDPKDGVSAPRVLPRLYMIPTFWKADGYGKLRERLLRRLTVTPAAVDRPGNLIEFSYDWRLSNQLNAQRLADTLIPHLERWRHHTQNVEAKLILICHSMGGLVARWFLEMLGGRELTRSLITIGTPYQGSVNALDAIVNELFLGPWANRTLSELVRSFPSVYQLLPTYSCLDLGDGQMRKIRGVDLPNASTAKAWHSIHGSRTRSNNPVATGPLSSRESTSRPVNLRCFAVGKWNHCAATKVKTMEATGPCRDRLLIRPSGRTMRHRYTCRKNTRFCNQPIRSSHRSRGC